MSNSHEDRDFLRVQPEAFRAAADRRTARRRRLMVGGVVTLGMVGAVGAVALLSQDEPSTVTTSQSDTDTPLATVRDDQLPPTTTSSTDAPVNGTPTEPGDAAEIEAQLGAPSFAWRVVEPTQNEAISESYSFGSNDSFPTFALSTAPGRSTDYDNLDTQLWRTEDGITWSQTNLESPFAADFWRASPTDTHIFGVGTAPGIAAGEPNPLQVAVADATSTDWSFAELPIDVSKRKLPDAFAGSFIGTTTFDGGLLISVTARVHIDPSVVSRASDRISGDIAFTQANAEGVSVIDTQCAYGQPHSPFDTIPDPVSILERCPETDIAWQDTGVPQETIDAFLTQATRFFTVSPSLDVTEISPPAPGIFDPVDYQQPLFWNVSNDFGDLSSATRPAYEFTAQGWVDAGEYPFDAGWSGTPQHVGGRSGVFAADHRTRFGTEIVFATDDGETTSRAKLQPILGDLALFELPRTVVAADMWVGVVSGQPDPIVEAGGVEFETNGVVFRRERSSVQFEVIDAETRAEIDSDLVTFDDGNVVVRAADGSVRVEMFIDALFTQLEGGLEYSNESMHQIVTTTDGVTFSVESVADLLGREASELRSGIRISSDGNTVVVTAKLEERWDDDSPKTVVLVGTPIG